MKQAYAQNLSDNVRHSDLTDLEIALGLKFFKDQQGYELEDLVSLFGKGETTVYNLLRLTELEQEIQRAVHENQIGLQQALEIARFPNFKRLKFLEETIRNNLSVRDLKRLRANAGRGVKQVSLNLPPHLADVVQGLSPEAVADMIRSLSPESQKRIMRRVVNVGTRPHNKGWYDLEDKTQWDAVNWDRKTGSFGYDGYYKNCILLLYPKVPKYGCEYSLSIAARDNGFVCPNTREYVVLAPYRVSWHPHEPANPLDFRPG